MAGYNGYSMSNGAVEAYDSGLLPASKAAKLLKVSAAAVKEVLTPAEWHHTSSKFNETSFYDVTNLVAVLKGGTALLNLDFEDAADAAEQLLQMRKITAALKKGGEKIYTNCTVEWLEWPFRPGCGGRYGDKWPDERKEEGCMVKVKGQTATVIFAAGKKMTKRLSTTGFNFYNRTIEMEAKNGCENQKVEAA